jgi:hypothetical protein
MSGSGEEMIHVHICNDSDAVWQFLFIITCTSVRSCGTLCGQIFCFFRFCVNMFWMVGNVVPVPPDSLAVKWPVASQFQFATFLPTSKGTHPSGSNAVSQSIYTTSFV